MEKITFKSGVFHVTLNQEEAKKNYEDVDFLNHAVLSVLNPDACSKHDMDFSNEQYMEFLYDYFINETSFTNEFINKVFKK